MKSLKYSLLSLVFITSSFASDLSFECFEFINYQGGGHSSKYVATIATDADVSFLKITKETGEVLESELPYISMDDERMKVVEFVFFSENNLTVSLFLKDGYLVQIDYPSTYSNYLTCTQKHFN